MADASQSERLTLIVRNLKENIMTSIFQTELQTFEAHMSELLVDNAGKFALIKGDRLVDIFDTNVDALRQGYKEFGNVPFLVKQITLVEQPAHFTSNLLRV